ncbi:MAG: SurA N-terminal domain-containing protein [Bacteroidales bacterium]|nr:SurA N-terminal domain-containing protein [Bacteroidales bacterium]
MAVLQKIRVKFGLAISIIIALALLSFIIDPTTLQNALNGMSSRFDVGRIAGKRVSYTDFQENVDKFTTVQQVITGGSVTNEQSQQQIRNAAWQDFMDRYMFIENAKDAGIRIGTDEMVDMTTGDGISPILSQSNFFLDESGAYSPDALRDFVQNVNTDETGRLKTFWNYLQNSILTNRYYEKYNSLFSSSDYLPQVIADRELAEANTTFNVEYLMVPFNYNDTTVKVTGKDIQKYYNAHKDNYKQAAGRDIEYVVYEVVPSAKDVAATSDEIESLLPEFASTANMKAFLLRNSEQSLSERWYKAGELRTVSGEVNDFVFGSAQGVSPVYKDGNVFRSVKVMASAMVPDSVYVKHILLQGNDARHLADSLCAVAAKGGNFAGLAALYSVDQNSAADGELGNLGWFTQTYTIPGFESCITAELGKPFVLNTQYGSHVVVVTKRTKPVAKKQVAILEKTALASKETFNDYYSKANRFATIAGGTYEGYKKAIDSTGVYSHTMNNVTEATSNYGSIGQAKEITRWVYDSKQGKASNIITVNNNYFFVVALKAIREEGYKPVKEVSSSINEILRNEQLKANTCAQVAEKINGLGTLEEMAEALGVQSASAEGVSFSSMSRSSVESALRGAASVAPENEICGPVAGEVCVYVFKVTGRETGSVFTADDIRDNEAQKVRYSAQGVLPEMMKKADVKDNRARFF